MDARSVIAELRAGRVPDRGALVWFANGLANGEVSDAQAGAFAMAVCLNGLGEVGRVALTMAMRDSGDVLKWDLAGPVLDKHSTGGIGDCVSLLLAPALAACGAYVPMISGRGLGHTGGTLDKLESIPGLETEVTEDRLRAMVGDIGCAIVSASGQIAPADKRLYAVRDVTATVESIDLITASILSKKLAAGLQGLVLDVKVGSGAFMTTMEDAVALAESLVDTANGAGCPTTALITDMNQPLVMAVGNALEIIEVMEALTGGAVDPVLCDLTADLGAELLVSGGLAGDLATGAAMIHRAIDSGQAAERFGRMVAALGGPSDFVLCWRDRLPAAPVTRDVLAGQSGIVTAMDGRALGMAVVHLGGGRLVGGARIDPSVGFSDVKPLGEAVDASTPLLRIHAATQEAADQAEQAVLAAISIGPDHPDIPPTVYQRIT
jgi:thymidine phosphorylase